MQGKDKREKGGGITRGDRKENKKSQSRVHPQKASFKRIFRLDLLHMTLQRLQAAISEKRQTYACNAIITCLAAYRNPTFSWWLSRKRPAGTCGQIIDH
ncbi:hypothetical protein B0X71_16835 [Planococcus lenghuensis]|uniref:Uncharacterized protein n=1 Tax=Planococcus lenghuensis TaxID=2213202 RepID=A0A1Q2L2G7_9BACL|nr:hypothetical protein B0X71_16835 [Planococcus lenghuensis]